MVSFKAHSKKHLHPINVSEVRFLGEQDGPSEQILKQRLVKFFAMGRGAYIDSQTGVQRILSHPNATPPHGHVNNPAGLRIGPDGSVVPPNFPGAHLPINYP